MPAEYGLVLPHFGEHASAKKVIEGSKRAEALGFDSVWVRDHLLFHPHGMEGTDNTFIDPFVTLAAVGGVTTRIKLGTGSLIPHRHPLLLALMVNSLIYTVGNRLVLGLGLGNFQHEFDAIGMADWKRDGVVPEQVAILRKAWTEDHFSFDGKYYQFRDVGLKPRPAVVPRIWYAGGTPASVRRALEYCDGWLPGRITLATYRKRVEKLRSEAEARGRARLLEGCIPITSIDEDRATALRKVNIDGLLSSARKQRFWVKPSSGEFTKPEDLEGSLICGTPNDVVNEVQKYLDVGIDHLVFDLRFRFDEWERSIELLGQEVLPRLRQLQS
ncbi:MAG: LLM class flavin-dependent oxidoreductase [Acidobacteria bacterium]|nr:LLM class flavin-dependent oxidoreductase [Acidobacteriota bacterium]